MNRTQKIAWFILISIVSASLISGIAIWVLYAVYGASKALAGFGFMGISGLAGLAPLFFKKEKIDERDKMFSKNAAMGGFAASYLFIGLITMLPCFLLGPTRVVAVPIWLLPLLFLGAALSHYLTWSVAILVQYGRDK